MVTHYTSFLLAHESDENFVREVRPFEITKMDLALALGEVA